MRRQQVNGMKINVHAFEQEHLESAFDLATRVFVASSTLHRALGIELNEYQDYLRRPFEKMVEEGLSVAATDLRSNKLVGCLIVTDFTSLPTKNPALAQRFAPMLALTAELCRRYELKRKVSVGDAALVDMGAVSAEAIGQGIYQQMRNAAHEVARNKGYKIALGELSSAATQRVVLNKLMHSKMAEIQFADFQFSGEYPFSAIKEPPSIILSEGAL
ncbi:hypothetical protein [Ruegeria arenilitoris]|uniref:hypothetical protein n=1 Tax=Ruegeria arenilitoris TaxID=1173585 RepID=UPI00147ADD8F|nr:hypothetical protein [Ruegeria arenilitoris]